MCELSLELKLPKATLAAGHCRRLEAIKVDNLTYTLPAPLALTAVGQAPAITAAIQQALDLFGLGGTANLVDIRNDADYFYFSSVVTGTQAGSMSWVLQSCDQSPAYSSDCCIIAPISVPDTAPTSGLPFSTCADLYHQRMRYSGLDIANITLGSSCDARLVNNYSYDALHRITAMHNSLIRPGLAADNAYSTSYSYDRAGNIQHLTRRGFVGMSGATPVYDLIDDLHYSYAPNANPAANAFSSKLQGVNDMVTDAAAQPRGVFLESSGYIPDGNGNLRTAGSVTAEYNILNLPTKLATSNGDRKFEYVFGGGKYSAELITGNPAIDEMRHYIGGMEFKDGVLEAYNFGDGRVVFHDSVPTLRFQYRLHDHLGNTVVFFEDKNNNGCITTEDQATSQADLEIIQRLLYYPFGMALEGLGAWNAQPWQQYRYNGKERDTLTGWYDYGARWGLLDIGRWNGVDPMADGQPSKTPYNFVSNNPISRIDPDGNWDVEVHAYNNRAKSGYALLIVKNNAGVEVYRTVVRTIGTGGRDRNVRYSDTPQGQYKILGYRKTGAGTNYKRSSFGPNDLLALDYQGGEGGSRNGMHVHGGQQEGKNKGRKGLADTWGCMRICDDDIKEVKEITTGLEANDPNEKAGYLTVTDDLNTPVEYDENRKDAGTDQFPKPIPDIFVPDIFMKNNTNQQDGLKSTQMLIFPKILTSDKQKKH